MSAFEGIAAAPAMNIAAVSDPNRHFAILNCRIAKGLLDHLVGGYKQARRHAETKCLRGF